MRPSHDQTSPGEEWLPTRQSLLSRLRDWEDSASWQEFFDRYWKLIYGIAIKSGLTETEAQEVVQETMVTVSKKMPGFKYDPGLGSFKGWLLHITRWRIQDQIRKRRRELPLRPHAEASTDRTATVERIPDPEGDHIERLWDEEWQRNLFELAVDRVKKQVSPKQYQLFDAYVLRKWPLEKITGLLGVTDNQVYLAKHRIGELLKDEIKALESKWL